MSPRPYRLGQRRPATERTRSRILDATRRAIMASGGFSIDSVAREAGVSRMTVYYQFGSKLGLLEALFEDLGTTALLPELPGAIGRPEPLDALRGVIHAFVNFWAGDRVIIRRVRALAALDPDFDRAIRNRDERRRGILREIIDRLPGRREGREVSTEHDVVDILHALTSFAMFDALAGEGREPQDVGRLVLRLCFAALALLDE